MMQKLMDSTTVPLLRQAATFGARRQEVLAGNIANIDTPNYRTRDLPVQQFQQAMRKAIQAMRSPSSVEAAAQGSSPGATSFSDLSASPMTPLHNPELFRAREAAAQNITFHDANNRSIEHEVSEMMKNSMMQSYAVELMNAQMRMLLAAVSERV